MTRDCVRPKCAQVLDRCQCPNAWIEYLAHTAVERRKAGLPRLSLRHHAKEYKKAASKFKLAKSVGPCKKSNTTVLCGWRSSRRGMMSHVESRNTKWDLDLLRLKHKGIGEMKGEPGVRTLESNGKPLIIKKFGIRGVVDKRSFLYETLIHRKLCETIPNKVPKLYKAYFLQTQGSIHGIHIMERLKGVLLQSVVPQFTTWPPAKMQQLARGLKDLFESLDKSHCYHGDLQGVNIIIDIDAYGIIKNVQAIDFGNSIIGDAKPNMNLLGFLNGIIDDTRLIALIPYLRKAGLGIPQNILEWSDVDFERHTFLGVRAQFDVEMKADPKVSLDEIVTD